LAILVIGSRGLARLDLSALIGVGVGAAATGLGLALGRVAWTGRAPARWQEYGLDAGEVKAKRSAARAAGTLTD